MRLREIIPPNPRMLGGDFDGDLHVPGHDLDCQPLDLFLIGWAPIASPTHRHLFSLSAVYGGCDLQWRELDSGTQVDWMGMGPLDGENRWYFEREPRPAAFISSQLLFDAQGARSNLSATQIHDWRVRVPIWFLMLLSGVLPAVWWRLERRRRTGAWRKEHQLCIACGYDIRATPDRCPECGTEAGGPHS